MIFFAGILGLHCCQIGPTRQTLSFHKTKMMCAASMLVSWTVGPGLSALRSFTTRIIILMRRYDVLKFFWNLGLQALLLCNTMYFHKTQMYRAASMLVSWTPDPGLSALSALRSFTT